MCIYCELCMWEKLGDVLRQQRSAVPVDVTPSLYVTMEILSNWGNSQQVGLTEMQFFCLRNRKLFVSPHDLDIRNADSPGNLGALVNGKAKVMLHTSRTFPAMSGTL